MQLSGVFYKLKQLHKTVVYVSPVKTQALICLLHSQCLRQAKGPETDNTNARNRGAAVLFETARIRKRVLKPLVCMCLGLERGR